MESIQGKERISYSYWCDISNANKAKEAGLYKTWQLLATNQLKVFGSLVNWLSEFRIYRRDELTINFDEVHVEILEIRER